jgi:hypothetical protein
MSNVFELAEVSEASATWGDGQLTIRASGTVPESCWRVDIQQSPPDGKPAFVAIRRRTAGICMEVITPYVVVRNFTLGARPDSVELHHAGGDLSVRVDDDQAGVGRSAVAHEYDEAEGRSSRRLSFDEAFANAVEALPTDPPAVPDWLETVVVTEIRGEFGGIAGSHDLVVRVRRGRPPA